MSNGNTPTPCAYAWILASLRNDATLIALLDNQPLRIEPYPHSVDQVYPAIGFSELGHGMEDIVVVEDVIAFSEVLLSVTVADLNRVITPQVQAIANRMHIILHGMFGGAHPVNDYGTVISCSRVGPLCYTYEDKEDGIWQFLGGTYRLRCQ